MQNTMGVNRLKRSSRIAIFACCAALAIGCPERRADDPTSGAESSGSPGHGEARAREGRFVESPASPREQSDAGLIEQLRAIGYLRGSRETEKSGVTRHDRTRAHPGINLYASGHAPEAILMDMDGGVLHRWQLSYESAFGPLAKPNKNSEWWRRVALFENGDLLAIFEGMGLVKLDKDSKLIWASELDVHHDLEVQENGDLYILTRKAHRLPRIDPAAPVLEDFVSILSADGELKAELSLLEAFENSRFADLVHETLASGNGDLFHTNTIALLNGRIAHRDRAFEQGNFLTSMNRMGIVAVVNPRLGKVIWVRRTAPVGQHDPKILSNGNMLLFTNNMGSDASVVEEFDPVGGKVHWSYRGNEEHPFYSKYLGTADRLSNGNTLITESDGGRAFEVTRDGETVWEFYNPNRSGSEGEFIATLPELIRLPRDYPIGWASAGSKSGNQDSRPGNR
jgi:hypothetical protein